MKDSVSTLESLSRLLTNLPTIVVQDHISSLVKTSMDSLQAVSFSYLDRNLFVQGIAQ
jgi:hypothetical protein